MTIKVKKKKGTGLFGNLNPAKRPEVRAKISKALKGREITWGYKISETKRRKFKENPELRQEFSKNISKKLKNYYKTHSGTFKGKHHTEETIRKISKANKGNNHTEEWKERMSKLFKKKYIEDNTFRKNQLDGNKKAHLGIKQSIETRRKRSFSIKKLWQDPEHRNKKSGANHWNWIGGISENPYSPSFYEIKYLIKLRDNFQCQICSIGEEELPYKLCIHHIDFNKQNNSEENLITLCRSCNVQVNYARKKWTKILKQNFHILSSHQFFKLIEVKL